MAKKDPVLAIKNKIDNNWDNSNTSISYDPQIHTGWYNQEASNPQVTITNIDEGSISRGDSPFFAIDGAGGGPVSFIGGTIEIDCWSDREVEEDVNPKKLAYEFSEEVKRIVKNNTESATDLLYIGYDGRRFLVNTDVQPASFRYQVDIRYAYFEHP